MTGSYDQNLSILSVSNLLLHSTGYKHTILSWNRQKAQLRNFMTRKIYWSETVCSFTEQGSTDPYSRRYSECTSIFVKRMTDEAWQTDLGYVRTGQLGSCNLALLNEAIYSGFRVF